MPIDDPSSPTWHKLKPFETPLSARDLNSIAAAVLRLVQFSAAPPLWITKTSAGYTIGFRPSAGAVAAFPARTEGHQLRAGLQNQWLYAFREVEWSNSTMQWEDKPGGRTSFVAQDPFVNAAVNGCEAPNDGTGEEGVGVDFNLPPLTCAELVPIADGVVVAMMDLPISSAQAAAFAGPVQVDAPPPGQDNEEPPAGTTSISYWFSVPNAVKPICPDDQGQCPPDPPGVVSAPVGGATRAGPGLEIVGHEVRLRTDRTMRLDARDRVLGVEALAPLARHPSLGQLALQFAAIGDLLAGTGAYRGQRLPVGVAGDVLTPDATAATGLVWRDAWEVMGIPVPAYKTGNTTINNDNSLNDDPHLSMVLPVGRYRLRLANTRFTSSTTADFRWDFTFSGTATIYGLCFINNAAAGSLATREITAFSSMVNFGTTTGTTHVLSMDAGIAVTAAGTIVFRWAQNTAEVSDTVVYEHATFEALPTE